MSMSHTGGKTEVFAKKAFGDNTEIVSAAGAGQRAVASSVIPWRMIGTGTCGIISPILPDLSHDFVCVCVCVSGPAR